MEGFTALNPVLGMSLLDFLTIFGALSFLSTAGTFFYLATKMAEKGSPPSDSAKSLRLRSLAKICFIFSMFFLAIFIMVRAEH